MDKKAIFLDLDGTLLNDQKEITEGNRAAIYKALEAGHKVIINTGRPLVSAVKQAEALGLTTEGCYLVSFNGGILYNTAKKEVIFKVTIPVEYVKAVFEEANRRGIHIQTYNDTKVLVEPHNDNDSVRRYCSLIHMEYEVISDIHDLVQEPVKMLVIDYHNKKPLLGFQEWLTAEFGTQLDNFFSCNEYIEVVPKGLNKGNALRQMAALLDIPMEKTIAAGDAANDYMMIQAAHTGVCMANGTDELKAIADYVTTRDNNHDGIAEIIEKFIL